MKKNSDISKTLGQIAFLLEMDYDNDAANRQHVLVIIKSKNLSPAVVARLLILRQDHIEKHPIS